MKTWSAVQTIGVLVSFVAFAPSTTRAITVSVAAAGGDPGSSVEVQIVLTGGNGLVAGMQTDITWDSNCLSVVAGNGGAACRSNPDIPKSLTTKSRSPSDLRALFLSMSDVEPIKQDTWLFSCQFTISSATTATQCAVNLVNVILSDSKGGRLPVTTANGVVQIHQAPVPGGTAVSGEPAASAAPGVPGAASAPASAGQTTSGGCAIAAPRAGGGALPWLLILPVLVHRRRQRSGIVSRARVRTAEIPSTSTRHDMLP